jgi:putative redox protein
MGDGLRSKELEIAGVSHLVGGVSFRSDLFGKLGRWLFSVGSSEIWLYRLPWRASLSLNRPLCSAEIACLKIAGDGSWFLGTTDMIKIEIEHTGSLHSEALHTESGTRIHTDAPLDNGGKGESFSPTDLLATALGTCMTTTMDLYAKKNGFSIGGAKAVVLKHMVSQPSRRVGRLDVVVEMPLSGSHPEREALERVALNCPVAKSLSPDIRIPVSFSWRDDL